MSDIPTSLSILSDDDLVDEATACRLIGGSSTPIHRSTLWRGINAGRYPKPLKISASVNRWRVAELRQVLSAAAAERTAA
jgi:predicted DNA-binding transcriptional regulator AlpA